MIGSKPPSAADLAHMGRCKAGPCIPCLIGVSQGLIEPHHACRGGAGFDGHDLESMQFNHCKSGNLRRGHRHGFAICLWHHFGSQQLHALGLSAAEARARWGPSMLDEGRRFREVFGSDDDIIAVQLFVLEQQGAPCGSV